MKKNILRFAVAIFIIAIFSSFKSLDIIDLDNDDSKEWVSIVGYPFLKEGEAVLIINRFNFYIKKLWKPSEISFGDIDADGVTDVGITVYKKTPLHQYYFKRPFIYEYVNFKLRPKLLISRLQSPIDSFKLEDVDGDARSEIVAHEGDKIRIYKQKTMGFELYKTMDKGGE